MLHDKCSITIQYSPPPDQVINWCAFFFCSHHRAVKMLPTAAGGGNPGVPSGGKSLATQDAHKKWICKKNFLFGEAGWVQGHQGPSQPPAAQGAQSQRGSSQQTIQKSYVVIAPYCPCTVMLDVSALCPPPSKTTLTTDHFMICFLWHIRTTQEATRCRCTGWKNPNVTDQNGQKPGKS